MQSVKYFNIDTMQTHSLMKRKARLYLCLCYWSVYC